MFYSYILKLDKDGGYYYGSTKDLKRRVTEHQNGAVETTRSSRPVRVIYYEAYESIQQARIREKQVKSYDSIRLALKKRISLQAN